MGTLLSRIRAARDRIHRRRLEAELTEEIEDHRARRQGALEGAGVSPADAAAASRRALGNVTLAHEDARAEWGWPSFERLWRDVRYGARVLRRQPAFALTAILTLAAGVGLTTVVFSVVQAELWRPLPFPESRRLVGVFTSGGGLSAAQDSVSGPDFLDWQSGTRSFEELAAFRWTSRRILRTRTAPEPVRVIAVTPNFFTALRLTPAMGRGYTREDGASGRAIVLSHAAWRQFFDADPHVVGASVTLDDQPFEIVGVLDAGDRLEFINDPDLFTVIEQKSIASGNRNVRDLNAIARLERGVTLEQANADLRTVALRLAHDYPAEHAGRGAWVGGLRETYTGSNWRSLLLFLGAAALVMLLSCANVANLLLARALVRQREFAIRGALGGGRGALLRQLIVEGSLVALPAGAIGLMLAAWGIQGLAAWLPPGFLHRGGHFGLDAQVYFAAVAASVLTALVFGLTPALIGVRGDLSGVLAQGGRSVAGSPVQRRARHAMVVTEITIALVLLCGAGLFLNSFLRLRQVPLGFDPGDRVTMRILLSGARYADSREIVSFLDRLVAQTGSLPGVRDAAIASSMPLDSGGSAFFVRADRTRPSPGAEERGLVRTVSPEFMSVLSIRRLAGRDLTRQDVEGAPRVALINENLARRVFAGENPVGKELVVVRSSTEWVKPATVQVVGVVSNIKDVDLNEVDFNDIYLPLAQNPAAAVQLIVRTTLPPDGVVASLRREVHTLDSDIPIYGISTMAQRVEQALRGGRFNLSLIGAFALAALLLAWVGIYGAMLYAIEQRTQEFGVRLALGARPVEILRLALDQSARLGAIGTGLGLGISLALARSLGNGLYLVEGKHGGMIYGVTTTDPVTLTSACVGIVGAAVLAGLVPARRAARVDPIVALRCD